MHFFVAYLTKHIFNILHQLSTCTKVSWQHTPVRLWPNTYIVNTTLCPVYLLQQIQNSGWVVIGKADDICKVLEAGSLLAAHFFITIIFPMRLIIYFLSELLHFCKWLPGIVVVKWLNQKIISWSWFSLCMVNYLVHLLPYMMGPLRTKIRSY